MPDYKKQATHTSKSGKYFYRVFEQSFFQKLDPFNTGLEFWDVHRNRWSESAMCVDELIEINKG